MDMKNGTFFFAKIISGQLGKYIFSTQFLYKKKLKPYKNRKRSNKKF